MSIHNIIHILSSQERLDHIGSTEEEPDSTAETEDTRHSIQGPTGDYYHPLPVKLTSLTDNEDEKAEHSEDVYERGLCGIGICQPAWCKRLANLYVFVITYGVAGIWMITLSTLFGSQVTSIERHLGLSSSKTGLLISSNEIGYLVVVILGSHLGKYSHIPRCLSASGVIFGLATVAMSFGRLKEPAVWKDLKGYDQQVNTSDKQDNYAMFLCKPDISVSHGISTMPTNESSVTSSDQTADWHESASTVSWPFVLIMISSMVGGAVKSYRLPILTHYIESNIVNKNRSGLLLGISFTAMILGPAVALFLGGYISSLPVDLKETSLSNHDQRWVGAWWLGFVIVGSACIVCALPIMFFPRHIKKKVTREVKEPQNETSLRLKLMDLPKSLGRIFRKPVYVLALVFSCIEGFAFSGWFAFSQKYIETQFNKTSQEVSTITGFICLFTVALGTFSGGFFTTKLKLEIRGCAIWSLAIAGITVLMDSLNLVFGCSNSDVVGTGDSRTASMLSCTCSDDIFIVCGDDSLNYLSPCLAGCFNSTGTTFTNCTGLNNGQARPGLCELDCDFFIPFLVLYCCGFFLGTTSIIPGFMLTIRSVEHRDQSLASGTASFCQTLMGILPSPIFFGRIIDSSCSLWSTTGSCMMYDRERFRYLFQGISIGLRVASVLVMALLLCVALREKRRDDINDKNKTVVT